MKKAFFILVILNITLLVWHFSRPQVLDGYDPERLNLEVRANAITVLDKAEFEAAKAQIQVTAGAATCVLIRPVFAESAEQLLTTIYAIGIDEPGHVIEINLAEAWLVYLGRFPDRDIAFKNKAALQKAGVSFATVLESPEFQYGVSLGLFESKDAANAQLSLLNSQGINAGQITELVAPPNVRQIEFRNLSPGEVRAIFNFDPRAQNCR